MTEISSDNTKVDSNEVDSNIKISNIELWKIKKLAKSILKKWKNLDKAKKFKNLVKSKKLNIKKIFKSKNSHFTNINNYFELAFITLKTRLVFI